MMPLPDELQNRLAMTAEVTMTDMTNLGEQITLPEDEYPLAQIVETLDSRICPLCEFVNGKIIRRGTPEWAEFSRPSHINCRRRFVYFHKDTLVAGRPLQPTFTQPPPALIRKHGHFHLDPQRYEHLRVPALADRRQFVFKRIRDEATGEIRSVIVWQVPPRRIEGLLPTTLEIAPVSEETWVALKPLLRERGIKVSEIDKAIVQLADDPTGMLPALTREAVAEVAVYMNTVPHNPLWDAILQGHPARRALFLHEHAEMNALKQLGVRRIFTMSRRGAIYWQAHAMACWQEAQYWSQLAQQAGLSIPSEAFLLAHPWRSDELTRIQSVLQARGITVSATDDEIRQAREFYEQHRITASGG